MTTRLAYTTLEQRARVREASRTTTEAAIKLGISDSSVRKSIRAYKWEQAKLDIS